ncbi:meiosis-specific protein PAIR2-like [Carex rostrata]
MAGSSSTRQAFFPDMYFPSFPLSFPNKKKKAPNCIADARTASCDQMGSSRSSSNSCSSHSHSSERHKIPLRLSESLTKELVRSPTQQLLYKRLMSFVAVVNDDYFKRTILMKLLHYDEVTPEDYKPPFFRGCTENEAVNIWHRNPLKMEAGDVDSKHLALALKVKGVLDPCEGDNRDAPADDMSLGDDSGNEKDYSDSEIGTAELDRCIIAPNVPKKENGANGSISDDGTQDNAMGATNMDELTALVREWINTREINTDNISDVLSYFPEALIEEILDNLVNQGLLARARKDSFTISKIATGEQVVMQDVIKLQEVNKGPDEILMYMKVKERFNES